MILRLADTDLPRLLSGFLQGPRAAALESLKIGVHGQLKKIPSES